MPRSKTVTRRPTYGAAVRWIAYNDARADDAPVEELESYISTLLVADLFGAHPYNVAVDVQRTRHDAGPFVVKVPF